MAGHTVVFGGRGMVGAAVCRELVRRCIPVISATRTVGPGSGGAPIDGVDYRGKVDALDLATLEPHLCGARAVVVSIGLPPWTLDRSRAVQVGGVANVNILRAAAAMKVPRVVLVNATMPSWRVISGYREGKELAEQEATKYPDSCRAECGVLVLKPSAVSGVRYGFGGRVPIPLNLMMAPMRAALRVCAKPCQSIEQAMPGLFGGVLRPAVLAEELAAASADAIEASTFKGVRTLGTEELVGYEGWVE